MSRVTFCVPNHLVIYDQILDTNTISHYIPKKYKGVDSNQIHVFLYGTLVDCIDKQIKDYNCIKRFDVDPIIIEQTVPKILFVSEEELSEPIVNYLLKHNIDRACWMIDHHHIDCRNSFRYYGSDKPLSLAGYTLHTPGCDSEKCDLITYISGYERLLYSHDSRQREYNFKFMDYNNPCFFGDVFTVHPMLDKNMIMKIYQPEPYSHKSKEIENSFKSMDLDLYCVIIKYYQNMSKELEFIKLFDDENDDDCTIPLLVDKTIDYFEYRYAVSHKLIGSIQFSRLIINFPNDVSDIIYRYVDFESKEPQPIDPVSFPMICSKQKILEIYLEQYISKYHVMNLTPIDLDLWFGVSGYPPGENTRRQEVIRIQNNEDFVLNYCCKNKKDLLERTFGCEYGYVVSQKLITSAQFYELLSIPQSISDLIYIYVDFESREPNIFDIVEKDLSMRNNVSEEEN